MTFNIQQFIDHDYATDTRKDRRKGNDGTQEFFTPYSIVKRICGGFLFLYIYSRL